MKKLRKKFKESIIFDSCVWISAFLAKDALHQEATAIINFYRFKKYQLIIPFYVFLEVITVLIRENIHPKELTNVEKFFLESQEAKLVHINEKTWLRSISNYASTYRLKSFDLAILLATIELNPTKFITFDKKLHQSYENFTSKI